MVPSSYLEKLLTKFGSAHIISPVSVALGENG